MIGGERFVGAEVTIAQPEQRPLPVSQVVDPVGCARLLDTGAGAAAKSQDRAKRRRGNRIGEGESRVGWNREVDVEFGTRYAIPEATVEALDWFLSDISPRTVAAMKNFVHIPDLF